MNTNFPLRLARLLLPARKKVGDKLYPLTTNHVTLRRNQLSVLQVQFVCVEKHKTYRRRKYMNPQLLALLTAAAWGIGGYYEKKGLHLGGLSPQMGITIRTAVALIVLGAVSFPQWKTLPQAGTKALLMMIIGGGIVAGSVGMLCYYAAIKGAPLNMVMPIAFTSPFFGVLMGIIVGGEPLTWKTAIGALLTLAGIITLTV
jgi:bacterial/archaeal transporter family protein